MPGPQTTQKGGEHHDNQSDSGKGRSGPQADNGSTQCQRDYAESGHCGHAPSFATRLAVRLVNNEFSGMPVAAPDGRVVGVITEADIIRALIEGKRLENLTAAEVMSGPAVTVDAKTSLEETMKCLQEHKIVRVPVTADNKLVGIIARRDVIRAVLEPEFMVFRETQ